MLFFIHVPKAAGTSLRVSLEKALKERLIKVYQNQAGQTIEDAQSRTLQSDAVIYGHFGSWMHKLLNAPPHYATVLRNPVERVKSWYNFQASAETLPFYETTRQMSLADIIRADMTEQLSNHMTAMIAGREVEGPDDTKTLKVAKDNLKRFDFVSTLEFLEEDIPKLENIIGVKIGAMQHVNVTGHESPRASEDEDVIMNYNKLDMELYEFAKRLRGDSFLDRMSRIRWPLERAF